MNFLTDIQQAKLDFYKNHIEGIVRSEPSRVVAICHRCLKHIPLNHYCLRNITITRMTFNTFENWNAYSCPHCKANDYTRDSAYYKFRPIPHSIVHIVRHWIRLPKRKWFKKDPGEYVDEYVTMSTHTEGK